MPTETSDHPDVLTRSVSGHGPRTLGAAALVVALSLSWSCAYQTASPHENAQMRLWVRRIASPAVGRCAEPFVARGTDGHAWLSWVERKKGGGHALRVSSFGSGTWSPVRTVAEGTNWFVNWADSLPWQQTKPACWPLIGWNRMAMVLTRTGSVSPAPATVA